MASKRTSKRAEAKLLHNATGYVAFLDILGFRELLEKPNHASIIEEVVDALQRRVAQASTSFRRLARASPRR
jgi:hypothetical protein